MAKNGAPGGGWPPPKDPTKAGRSGVTSAAAEMAGVIGDKHTADGFAPQPISQPLVESAPRPSALAEHAELTVAGTEEKMSADELSAYRAGEAARKERAAAREQNAVMADTDAAIAQMALESTPAPVEAAPAPVSERAMSSLEQVAEVVNEQSGAKMTPEELAVFRAGEERRKASLAEATPKEIKEFLKDRIQSEASKRVKESADDMKEAEKKYFDALAAHQKSRGLLSVKAEGFIGEIAPEKLKILRRQWVRSRATLARVESETVDTRIKDFSATRKEAVERLKDKHGNTGEAALRARYEKMVRLRTVVLGAEERELEVRTEALGNRDKGTFEKALDWYDKNTPAPVRIMVSSALMFGAAAGIGALATGSFGIAPLALFGAGGGAAVRAVASMQKSEMGRTVLNWAAVVPSMAGVIGLAAEGAVRGVHALRGTEAKAEALLKQETNLGNLASMRNLEKLSEERKKALVVKKTIARQSMLARTLSSVGFGFLFGHHAGQQGVAHDHAESAATAAASPETGSPQLQVVVGNDAPSAHTSGIDTVPQSHSAPEVVSAPATSPEVHALPTAPEAHVASATIHTPGEGFGQMIMELKQSFQDQLHGATPSPAMQHVLNTDPNDLSREIGAITGNSSLQMHQGDQLFADEHGDIWFQPRGQDAQLVFHNDPTAPGGYTHHTIEHGVFRPDQAAPQEDPSAALNRAQLAGHEPVVTAAPEPVTVEHVDAVKPFDGSDIQPSSLPSQLDATPVASPAEAPHTHDAAPSAPEAHTPPRAEHAPVISPETPTFTNPLGVEVNPGTPSMYAIPTRGGGEVFYMFGGQGNASFLAAQQYALAHPGVEVRFTAESIDSITGVHTPMSGVFRSDATGALMGSPVDPYTGNTVTAPDPMTFARKLDFTYKPR